MLILNEKDSKYPKLFREIYNPPRSLYCNGNIEFLSMKCLTIVGTRSITPYGRYLVKYLLEEILKDLDVVIVSGLALGIDAMVHRVCLERGIKTIAIVPGSMRSSIPKKNEDVFNRISNEGLLIAEYPEGKILGKEMYILRNRLLAAISNTTIVLEAGENSGSLITARYALEYNRDVYVIPGNINNEMSKGCNSLLKEGAGIITSIEDFRDIVGIQNDQVLLNIS
ncbi:MAG: DNA-processing protein DprA [Candidatus Dojkabacteria bacterium]